MRSSKIIRIILIALELSLLLMVCDCLGFFRRWTVADNAPIERGGCYRVDGGQKTLIVQADDVVAYRLKAKNGATLLENDEACNNLGFWMLYWEKDQGRLWELSSDAGYFVCIPDEHGKFQRYRLNAENVKIIRNIPKAIYERIKDKKDYYQDFFKLYVII